MSAANPSPSRLATASALCRLARPRQWIKNALVLMPAFFSGRWSDADGLGQALLAMALFCVASSLCYVVNDLHDIDSDRRHPDKARRRPLACGEVSVAQALMLAAALLAVVLASGMWRWPVTAGLFGYLALNFAYSRWLKRVAVVDLFALSGGFVIRTWVGSAALDLALSPWMGITVLCLALFLATLKRLRELRHCGTRAREVLKVYSEPLLLRYAELSAASALMCYALYILTQRPELALSVPFVLFGLFRYWQLVEVHAQGESPSDTLLGDPLLMGVAAAWLLCCLWAGG